MSQAETIDLRRGAFTITESPDRRSITLTLYGPRDGAGTETSAGTLSVVLNVEQSDEFGDRFAYARAGLDRSR